MTTMKLELPTENATVMYHMGEALRNIAISDGYGTAQPVKQDLTNAPKILPSVSFKIEETHPSIEETIESVSLPCDLEHCESVLTPFNPNDVTITFTNTNGDAVEMSDWDTPVINKGVTLGECVEKFKETLANGDLATNDKLDVNNLPWDNRIHSRGKTRNSDDTWRNARCPKEKTPEEWSSYIEEVETELKALMQIPVAAGEALDVLAEIPVMTDEQRLDITPPTVTKHYWKNGINGSFGICDNEADLTKILDSNFNIEPITLETYEKLRAPNGDITPPIVNGLQPPVVVTPPVVVAPPVAVVTPPVVVEASAGPKTFGELMKFITLNNKTLTTETVNETLKSNGLQSITLLATRTDLIPQIHAALVKLL